MAESGPQGLTPDPVPPGKPPFAPPPGTPWGGPPHDAEWTPPPGTAFAEPATGAARRGRRDRRAWPRNARPVPASREEPDADQDTGSRGVALLLAVAALVAAIVTAQASLVSSDASDAWQASVSDEQRRGALLLEGVRYTYGSEGDLAVMMLTADLHAQALRQPGASQPPDIAARLAAEAQVQQHVVELMGSASELTADPRYVMDGGGYDLQLRLVDSRSASPDDLAIDPLAELAAGDADAEHAMRLMLSTVGIGAAFLFGALAQAFRRRRRLLLLLGWASLLVTTAAAIAVELGA